MTQIRLNPDQRRNLIVEAALVVARGPGGVWAITFKSVAKACQAQTTPATVRRYFPRKVDLVRAAAEADATGLVASQALEAGFVL